MATWRDIPIYAIDFEGSAKTGVVEYGVVELRNGEIADVHTRLCSPNVALTRQDTQLHGIAQKDVVDCAPFADEWEPFRDWRGQGVFAAHHASVEHAFLKQQWSYPPASPDYLYGGKLADWGPWIDTRRLYEVVYPDLESYKLGDLLERFGLADDWQSAGETYCPDKRRKAHCALYDAIGSALLLLRLLSETGFEDTLMSWLLEKSLSTEAKRQGIKQQRLFDS